MQNKNTQKQVFWYTIIGYLGTIIGIISTVFIYPNNLEFLGIIRYVDAIAQLLFPILLFGAAQALINFYPTLSKSNQQQLFKYGISTIIVISIIVLIFLFLFDKVTNFENFKYVFYAFPIAFTFAFIELFKRQATNLQRLAVPTLFEKIIPKISLPIIFCFLLLGYFDVIQGVLLFVISYFILLLFLVIYLFKHFKITSNFNFKSLFSEMPKRAYFNYSVVAFLGSFGSFFAFRLDALMIPEFLSFNENGVYNIGVTLASVLAIPAIGMVAIYSPIISKYLKDNDIKELEKKYRQTAKLFFFIGALLYGSIILGIDSFFKLLPTGNKLVESIPIIFVLGANVLLNIGTGFNSEIIAYSKYYKFNVSVVLGLMVLNIVLNLFFLTQTNLGIIGVAYASLISMVIFNCLKLSFIYKKFGISPFDSNYIKLFLVFLIVTLGLYLMPSISDNLLNVIVKVGMFISISVFVIYKLKLISDFNNWFVNFLRTNNEFGN